MGEETVTINILAFRDRTTLVKMNVCENRVINVNILGFRDRANMVIMSECENRVVNFNILAFRDRANMVSTRSRRNIAIVVVPDRPQ